MLFDHNEKYSDRMERFYKAFAVTFELRFPFPLIIKIYLKITYLKINSNLAGANELMIVFMCPTLSSSVGGPCNSLEEGLISRLSV